MTGTGKTKAGILAAFRCEVGTREEVEAWQEALRRFIAEHDAAREDGR